MIGASKKVNLIEKGILESLKPCPLCGSENVHLMENVLTRRCEIQCLSCFFSCRDLSTIAEILDKKINYNLICENWNNRKVLRRHKKVKLPHEVREICIFECGSFCIFECPLCAKTNLSVSIKPFSSIICNSCGANVTNNSYVSSFICGLIQKWNKRVQS